MTEAILPGLPRRGAHHGAAGPWWLALRRLRLDHGRVSGEGLGPEGG